MREGDNLRNISTAPYVQAARTMALFTFDTLLRMQSVPKIASDFSVAGSTGVASDR
ncbi:MAG TPA: hypothetical protein VEI52_00240 [Terriglobales bacterium]|nr:hypothetical protein [Terriglobales bacterium]